MSTKKAVQIREDIEQEKKQEESQAQSKQAEEQRKDKASFRNIPDYEEAKKITGFMTYTKRGMFYTETHLNGSKKKFTTKDLLLLCSIAYRSKQFGYCYAKNPELAENMGLMSTKKFKEKIDRLRDDFKLIDVEYYDRNGTRLDERGEKDPNTYNTRIIILTDMGYFLSQNLFADVKINSYEFLKNKARKNKAIYFMALKKHKSVKDLYDEIERAKEEKLKGYCPNSFKFGEDYMKITNKDKCKLCNNQGICFDAYQIINDNYDDFLKQFV